MTGTRAPVGSWAVNPLLWARGLRIRPRDLPGELARDREHLARAWRCVHQVCQHLSPCPPAEAVTAELSRALSAIESADHTLRALHRASDYPKESR